MIATGPDPGPPPPCGTGNDWDGDLLSNALEAQLGTDPCKKDTDGDGVDDGFEYKSAVDLNDDEFQNPNNSLPYPGKMPYPNPLDGSDANKDFDGDSLTSLEEQKLWDYTITNGATRTLDPLTYSAGEKYSMSVRDVTTVTDLRVVSIQLDVTDPERIAEVARELDDVEVVVNNAGVLHVGVPLSASLDIARLELETNYLSLVSMTQAFAPVLERNGGGAFVNVLSVFSWVAAPLITTYSASKAAAWSFTNAARIELRRQGTHVVGVHAGPVDTDMTAAIDLEKIPPTIVAASALDALEADEPEAVVDDYSRAVKAGLSDDQGTLYPQIEHQFLAMTGAGTSAT